MPGSVDFLGIDLPMPSSRFINRQNKLHLLVGLVVMVVLSVIARPSALLTFGCIALAGTLSSQGSHNSGR